MKSVDFTDRLYSIKTQKSFGLPNELGHITLGVSKLGDYNPMAGIYRLNRGKKNKYNNLNSTLGLMILGQNFLGSWWLKKIIDGENHKSICRMRHYVPTNNQLIPQQAWRNYFATVLSSWQALTENEKNIWRKYNYPTHMSGYNRYLRKHLNARDIGGGYAAP